MRQEHRVVVDQVNGGYISPWDVSLWREIFGGDVALLVVPAGKITGLVEISRSQDLTCAQVTVAINGKEVRYEFSPSHGISVERSTNPGFEDADEPWEELWAEAPPAAAPGSTQRAALIPHDDEEPAGKLKAR
jgi:hypothetical protein